MTWASLKISILLIVAACAEAQKPIITSRLVNGHIVDSLNRFPHHVIIETDVIWNEQNRLCGGSILNQQWLITSGLCIDGSEHLQLHFKKLNYNSYDDDSFSIEVNKDAIHMHPTNYYDIALIQVPIELIFSDTLKPVSISSSPIYQLEGRLAVMPGFDIQKKTTTTTTTTTTTSGPEVGLPSTETSTTDSERTTITESTTELIKTTSDFVTDKSTIKPAEADSVQTRSLYSIDQPQKLTYGMFRILPKARCKYINSEFDEFQQLCTENWLANVGDIISCEDYGNGLLVGWPARPTLVGIYSVMLNDCKNTRSTVYTNVEEYLPWIYSIMDIAP